MVEYCLQILDIDGSIGCCDSQELSTNIIFLVLVLQGYGDNKPKSSTTAQEVKTLDGVYIEQVNDSIIKFWSAPNGEAFND